MTEFIDKDRAWADVLWARFKDGGWEFESYYKFSFTFTSKVDPSVTVCIGGSSDDIYGEDIKRDMDFSQHTVEYFSGIYRKIPEGYECWYSPSSW
jgi:hypothetical protein